MNVSCTHCGKKFELEPEIYEEGDTVECPECGTELSVVKKGKKITVIKSFEEALPEEDLGEEEFGEEYQGTE
ncbi:MAG: zinc-ribbon domain-containing protein [Candidatus Diapherotrites archaeon]